MFRKNKLPTIIITGASGFIGKYFLDYIKNEYAVIAIARRSIKESGVPFHPNIHWVQWDIGNKSMINEVMGYIMGKGGADYLIHFAAFYDFEYKPNPEYQHTNINGTNNILKLARLIGIKHFIFASSLTVTNFYLKGKVINENSSANANFSYAISKKHGENAAKQYSRYFKCSVVRLAAIYSDWCEYAPLYKFLSCWLSRDWDSRILGGKGESAITYLHIHDLCKLLVSVINKTKSLPDFGIYCASPDGSTSHKDLFQMATRNYFGEKRKAIFIPKLFTFPGLIIKQFLGEIKLISKPFERFWMLKYVDLKLEIDASNTRKILEWEPTPRYSILRRSLFLLEKMKSHPAVWHMKNEVALRSVTQRINLVIYEIMIKEEENFLKKIALFIRSNERLDMFKSYIELDIIDFQNYFSTLYHLLMATVRSGDRSLIIKYIDDIALQRFAAGFELNEIRNVFFAMDKIISGELHKRPEFKGKKQDIFDYISLTMQLAIDGIEDVYENLEQKLAQYKIADTPVLFSNKKHIELIKKLSAFHQDFTEDNEII
ncbi:MAG: NAD(P)-dependent oxidoreductase [Bacteroidales bacterium]|nr:NAD(P)-dependent oxidoreductase [Bacteroidales bacterium]